MDDHDDVLEKINNLYQQFHILNEAMGTNFKDISDLNISLNLFQFFFFIIIIVHIIFFPFS